MRQPITIPFTNIKVYTASSTDAIANSAASYWASKHVQIFTIATADWNAGPVTDYDNAAAYGSANAFSVDVEHSMNSAMAMPIGIKGSDGYIRRILIDPLTIDSDTTRVWIFAEQAPPYDVQLLFVG